MSETRPTFEEFVDSLTQLTARPGPIPQEALEPFYEAAEYLRNLDPVDRSTLVDLVSGRPKWVPMLGSVVGLSQEQLKRVLQHGLGSQGWLTLARKRPVDLVAFLDGEYGLVEQIRTERGRDWSYGDILFERTVSTSRAGRAIGRGRDLEDEVEAVVSGMGLPYALRTQFTGRGGRTASCDLAIPEAGAGALIVCAVKGFDSTGSKLSDAVREVESMADVREPRQFVYAVVDGIGWLGRQADLRRIHTLVTRRSIDGMFSLAQLGEFRTELRTAAAIHRLPLREG